MVFSSNDVASTTTSNENKEKSKELESKAKGRQRLKITPFHILLLLYSTIAMIGIVYRMYN